METLSNVKIESILSLSGNNKCFECESPEVDWVSFPAAIFICLNCGRRHKEFKFKPILKSLSVSEFTQHEIKKMNLGGNARYHALLDEYKISTKEPNIEYKYQTMISKYYFKLLETQVNKIENNIGADDEYNKILGERPTYDIGRQFSEGFITKEGDEIEKVIQNFQQLIKSDLEGKSHLLLFKEELDDKLSLVKQLLDFASFFNQTGLEKSVDDINSFTNMLESLELEDEEKTRILLLALRKNALDYKEQIKNREMQDEEAALDVIEIPDGTSKDEIMAMLDSSDDKEVEVLEEEHTRGGRAA